jgi:undecaprenyl diphosphate synthase
MDGNGRWARRRGLPRAFGHRAGVKALRAAVEASAELGIRYLTVYTFSTENWQRPTAEVRSLMRLFVRSVAEQRRDLMKNNVRVRVIGRLRDLPAAVRERLEGLTRETSANSGLTLTLAMNYGGRSEIVDACRRAVERGRPPRSDADFAALLYDPELPDPDLLIRTGGDLRVSNYLLWQLAYTELYFTDTLWPDFGRRDLAAALNDFARRKRRYGQVDG